MFCMCMRDNLTGRGGVRHVEEGAQGEGKVNIPCGGAVTVLLTDSESKIVKDRHREMQDIFDDPIYSRRLGSAHLFH